MWERYEEDIRGEILVSPPMVVEWKVPSFFSIPKEVDLSFCSPDFPHLGGMWYLECYPNGQKHTLPGWIDLFLHRKSISSLSFSSYTYMKRTITFHVGIRREDGTEYCSRIGISEFKNDSTGWGLSLHIERASLLKNKRIVAPRDEITIFCILRDKPTKDATSQTMRSGAIDASTETSEDDFKNSADEMEDEEASLIPAGIDKLSQEQKDAFLSGEYHDTIIKVKDEEFRTHKFILVTRSPVFASMFRHDTIERSTGVVSIEDCDPKAFKEFLCYLYSGKLENVCTENVLDLYFIADKYEVEEVKAECVRFMIQNFSIDNFCDFVSLGLRHDEKKLITRATDFFTKNLKNIIVTVKWQCFHKDYPDESNELYIKAISRLVPD